MSSVGHDSEWARGQFKSTLGLPEIGSSASKTLVTSCPTTFNGSLWLQGFNKAPNGIDLKFLLLFSR